MKASSPTKSDKIKNPTDLEVKTGSPSKEFEKYFSPEKKGNNSSDYSETTLFD